MNKKEKMLEFFKNKDYIPMKAKEIAIILSVPKEEKEEFEKILKELEKDYKIKKNKKNKYVYIEKTFIEGVYKGNENSYGFVETINDNEIFIPSKYKQDVMNGDKVLVEVILEKTKDKKAEGKIVKIINREKTQVVGTFQKSKNFGFVIPDDKKLGTDIFISKKNSLNAKNNQKVVVKIIKYPMKNKNAEGKVIEVLGNIDEAGIDMLSLIKEYKLPYEFPKEVLEEVKKINSKIDKKDIPNRVDLRDKIIFTIDGEDAKDLDDAVCVSKDDDGNYLLDVHIADVSYYVKENSNIDKEAVKRGTSVYMLDRVIPMLPFELSNGICSLNAGEDRFTLSVTMKIDKNGKVISSDVYKAVINVKERMTYTDVDKIINNKDKKIIKKYEKYIKKFKLMEELALILKNRRLKNGYLNLNIPESKIILDKSGKVKDVKKYETNFANEIIEQFMLTANETIAEKFYWLDVPFIYRVHETPDMDKVKELNKFLYNLGYKIKASKDNIYPTSFAKILDEIKGKEEEKVISNLILRTLKIARYESENKGHFGIASKYYCHFTSPIRRYPDLFIHRIISEYFDLNPKRQEKMRKEAEIYAKSSSDREKIATKVERDSEELKKAEYMQDKIGKEYNGIISNITNFGVFVELENTIEGLIRFENLGNEYFIYNDENKYLIGEKSNTKYKIGDKINIRVIEANKQLRKIGFEKV